MITNEVARAYEMIGAGIGSDVGLLTDELLWYIRNAIRNHPRSQQVEIGPSEVGHPCARRLGYKIIRHPGSVAQRDTDIAWLPTIGTAVHAWLADVFSGPSTGGRFLVETKVCAGTVNGDQLEGSSDLFDLITATVVDWKIVGVNTLRGVKSKGPGDQYRVQAHTYGRGFAARGLPVDRVMIAYLPRNGELSGAVFWSEPYDESVALAGLARLSGIGVAIDHLGSAALGILPTADAYCHRCPFYLARSADLGAGCPGHPHPPAQIPTGPAFGPV